MKKASYKFFKLVSSLQYAAVKDKGQNGFCSLNRWNKTKKIQDHRQNKLNLHILYLVVHSRLNLSPLTSKLLDKMLYQYV